MKKFLFILFLSSISLRAAEQIKVTALTQTTALPTNSLFLVSVVNAGVSSNSYKVALETIIRAGLTNGDSVYFFSDAGKLRAYASNIVDASISASANISASKLDSTLLTQTEGDALYQPLDSDLTAIAALTTTAHGRGLLDDADATASRVSIGVVIGTHVQAWDVDLDDLADGSLTGTKVGFSDPDSNFTATDIDSAMAELFDVINGGLPNAATGKIDWSQLVNVPAGIADGTDDTAAGGETAGTVHQIGDATLYALSYYTNSLSTNLAAMVNGHTDSTRTNLHTGKLSASAGRYTNQVEIGDGTTPGTEIWAVGGTRTNAGTNVGITNNIFNVWNSNSVFNATIYLNSGHVINWDTNDVLLTHSAGFLTISGGDFVVPTEVFDLTNWNTDNSVPTKDAIRDYIATGDTDGDGAWNVLDPTGTAGLANVNSSGVLQTPLTTHAGLVAIVTDLNSATRTATGLTYDAGGTGNVLKQVNTINLQRPDYGDGTGAIPQTNTFNVSGLMHYTLAGGTAETNANWIVYEFDVPPDFDTTVEMTARFAFLSGGTDTDDYVFHLTYTQPTAGSAYPTGTSIATSPIVMTVNTVTEANGYYQESAATTLTGWAGSITPGKQMMVRIAKPNNAQDDTARDVQLVLTYGSTK